ncbi:ketopantoate reductase family protein [Nocardia sp. CNY236]|uniref:ketopantoate reductase family protein n=1 Tax=Nocardia sp. CNY236 TaxID=1169152 RepID=UPI00048DE563|nr:2-dehydropantoate 2-reductase [Nocardia sp. CNY236]
MVNSPRYAVCVLGPGGIGGLVAALLARAGHRVICLGRPDTVRALRTDGIRLHSTQFGEFGVQVEADTELRERVDLCLITVKQTALTAAVERLAPQVTGDALLVPLLNGIEHPGVLRRRYRPELVAPGVIRVESTRTAPGRIGHGSAFAEIDLAGSILVRERLTAWAWVLDNAGLRVRVQTDETAMLWRKLFALAPFALMTTCYREPIGMVRTAHRAELIALLGEVAEICRAGGVEADVGAALRFYDGFPEGAMSSMLRDAAAGRPLELDAIGGALLRAGAEHSVPAPLTRALVERVDAASV